MNVIVSNYDVIFFAIIIVSLVFALLRGGVAEILSLSSWFIAFWLVHNFGGKMDKYVPLSVTSQFLRSCVVFVGTFILVAIIIAIVKKIMAKVISASGLSGLDRLLGVVFGTLRGVLICAILILLIEMLKLDPSNAWQKSRLYPILGPVVGWIAKAVPQQELPKSVPAKLINASTNF